MHHRGRQGGDAKGHCMFTHVTHVGQTIVICCRSLWVVMVSCKEEFSQDTQDRCATLGRLIPQVCLIRYGIPRFLGVHRNACQILQILGFRLLHLPSSDLLAVP